MKKISLAHLKADHKVRVAEILGGGNLHKRLTNMGIQEGREITKLSHMGLQGPVVIKAGRTILALGHGVAAKVMVETK